jgi:hypothetical protein
MTTFRQTVGQKKTKDVPYYLMAARNHRGSTCVYMPRNLKLNLSVRSCGGVEGRLARLLVGQTAGGGKGVD